MTSLHEPVLELVRASLDPDARQVRVRADSPICQVVSRAARADLEVGGLDHVTGLAMGASVVAACLTEWLSQERNRDVADVLDEMQRLKAEAGLPDDPVVRVLKALLTGAPGMEQAAEVMVTLFHEDEEGFYDFIVNLGDYSAATIDALTALGISDREGTLGGLEEMLIEFYAS